MRKGKSTKRCERCGSTKNLKTISMYPSRKMVHICAKGCIHAAMPDIWENKGDGREG